MKPSDSFPAIRRAMYSQSSYDCVCVAADESYDGKDHKCALHAGREEAENELATLVGDREDAERRAEKWHSAWVVLGNRLDSERAKSTKEDA